MATYENTLLLDTRETNPVITADASGKSTARGTKRAEQVVQLTNDELYAIEGSLAVFSNATAGTAVTSQASVTAYDATKLVLHIKNNETAKSVIVRYIKMFVATAPTAITLQKYEFRLDTQTGLTSGGTALTAKRCNLAVASPLGNVVATVGTMTTVAGSANEVSAYSGQMRNGVGAIGDEFLFVFGGPMNVNGYLDPATTVSQQKTLSHGPLIIAPGGALRMAHYGASATTAGAYEWEIGVIVR